MRPVAISLVHAFTSEIAVLANPAMDLSRPPALDLADLNCQHVTLQPDDKQPHWRVQLRLRQEATPKNNSPYTFRIAIEGWFTLNPTFPADQAERFVTVNGTSILYGIAREQLRQAMATGPFLPILLPSVTFAPAPAPVQTAESTK